MAAEQLSVLVTGANGFVGQALVNKVLKDGYAVTALVRELSAKLPVEVKQVVIGDLASLADAGYDALGGSKEWQLDYTLPFQEQQSFDVKKLNDVLQQVDAVVHTAARVHVMQDKASDPLTEFRRINTDATLSLAYLAAKAGVKRFIFLSTIKVNGELTSSEAPPSRPSPVKGGRGESTGAGTTPSPLGRKGESIGTGKAPSPLAGEGWGEGAPTNKPFDETDPPDPQDPYAISKWEAEQGLMQIAKETGMEVVVIRPPLIYGPGVKGNFASMMKWVRRGIPLPLGAVQNQRSLLALDNLVSFINHCLTHPRAANEVFLLSDGEDVSTTALIQKLATVQGKKARLLSVPVSWMRFAARFPGKEDVADRLFGSLQIDSSKARELLEWQPAVTMDEALKKLVPKQHF